MEDESENNSKQSLEHSGNSDESKTNENFSKINRTTSFSEHFFTFSSSPKIFIRNWNIESRALTGVLFFFSSQNWSKTVKAKLTRDGWSKTGIAGLLFEIIISSLSSKSRIVKIQSLINSLTCLKSSYRPNKKMFLIKPSEDAS